MFTQLAPYCSTEQTAATSPSPQQPEILTILVFFQETFSFKDENIQKNPVFDCRI